MFQKLLKPYTGQKYKGINGPSVLIITGVLLVLLSMAVTYLGLGYTYAVERASVSLGLGQQWVAGNPEPGQPGDLFNQLKLTVKTGDTVLYDGKLSGLGEPVDVTDLIGPITPGQPLSMDYEVYLPGRETGNEFQGSYLVTKFIVYAKCMTEEDEEIPCTISTEPEDILFDLGNLNPGDRYRGELKVTVKVSDEYIEIPDEEIPGGPKIPDEEIPGGPLPKTGEGSSHFTAIGFAMVVMGFILKGIKPRYGSV